MITFALICAGLAWGLALHDVLTDPDSDYLPDYLRD